ncbi:hypothetical protein [Paraglaciecola sp. L3A3]|uniref:hypothetical protein n=1 Tax=Paraglaciecola sp. L3A3 TaxID=2686358 RepID=UPI00131DB967|nr:hypothetical protein [Paraglaciecola sp. L3A3]
MSNGIFNIINPTGKDYPWKLAIKALFNMGDVIVPQHDMNDLILKTIKQDAVVHQLFIYKPLLFLEYFNIDVKDNQDEVAYLKRVYHKLHLTLDRAANLGLVDIEEKKPETSDGTEYSAYHYKLSSKGLDVVLRLFEHEDQEKRNDQQTLISERTSKASISSARTARRALFAAAFIAVGSIGNLVFTIYVECWK